MKRNAAYGLFTKPKGMNMKMEEYIRAIAGSFILTSLLLTYFHSPYWLLFTAFVGLNLLQSAFTRWCPMETILEKLGVPRSC
jgi:H+/gluconate symporter-like permease